MAYVFYTWPLPATKDEITYNNLLIFLIACSQPRDTNTANAGKVDTVHIDNGYLIKYYSSDQNRPDSTYKFEYKFDTLIKTEMIINYWTKDKILFHEFTDSLTITLNEPNYEYLGHYNLGA